MTHKLKHIAFFIAISLTTHAQRFAGIDYEYISKQQPVSDEFNLETVKLAFSTLTADISYGGYLNKEEENSLIFATLDYSKIKTSTTYNDTTLFSEHSNVPKHYYELPTVDEIGLSVLYNYSLSNNWDLIGNVYCNFTPNNKGFFARKNYNTFGLIYIQKQFKKLSAGIGTSIYVSDGKLLALPVASITYEGEKLIVDFMPPLSLDLGYKITDRVTFNNSSSLDFGGFSYKKNENLPLNNQPDYVDNTDFKFTFGIDYEFYESLFLALTTGYVYREINFTQNDKKIGKVKLENGLQTMLSFYIGF